MAQIKSDSNKATPEERENWNQQFETVIIKNEVVTDDESENKDVFKEKQTEIPKIEVKQEEMDINCDCNAHDPHSCNPVESTEQSSDLKSELNNESSQAMFTSRTQEKLKRKRISLEEKYNILERLKNGEKLPLISKELELNESTIRTIKKNENKIRHWVSISSSASINRVAHVKNTVLAKMENCLKIWIEDCNQKNIPVNFHSVKQKALKIFTYLKQTETINPNLSLSNIHQSEFNASKGWFERFKNRFSLHNLKIQSERATTDVEAAQKFLEDFKKLVVEGNYTADQVFNACETGLNWKKMESANDRITVLLCSNASGGYVTKPMLVNRSLNPRSMKGVDKSALPIHWRSNDKTWMTSNLFHDWFFNCFVAEIENYMYNRNIAFKALLLVDNAPNHLTDLDHPNVKIVFAPPNTTTIIQPLHQGAIKAFKSYYIRRTFEFIVNARVAHPNMTVTHLWKAFSMLNCIEIVDSSVKELKTSTLNACWKCVWPDVVTKDSSVAPIFDEANRIIDIAKSLGGNMTEIDVSDLINNGSELSEEELLQIADEYGPSIANVKAPDEPPESFDLDGLNEILQLAKRVQTYFADNDPVPERAAKFKRRFEISLTPYCNIQKELQNKMQRSNAEAKK